MEKDRPAIPKSIEREVRQRCGFGCVICGCPVYDYEHMLEWSVVQRHVASEITLLCPTHHRAKTSKRLSPEMVKKANEKPFNLNKDFSTPDPLYFEGEKAIVNIGDCTFSTLYNGNETSLIALQILEQPIIKVTIIDGHYLIDAQLYNKNNELLLSIKDSVLEYSLGTWDIYFVGNTLTIREGSRKIFVEIAFESPDTVSIKRGNVYFKSVNVKITPKGLKIGTSEISQAYMENVLIGIWISNPRETPPPSIVGVCLSLSKHID
ncbi:HNH endonuclease signature motif containing protein [Chryseobacterium indologenes]|uniref:HNH endonuclease signature motif containing protein n=1 Tax=Chryseobacterium indologenes TaxID=253 RepID=UPI0030163FB2